MVPSPSLHVLWLLVSMALKEDVCGGEDQVAGLVGDPVGQVEGQVNGHMDQVVGFVDGRVDNVAGLVDYPVDQMSDLVDSFMNQVAVVVSQMVEQHLTGCHLVLATTADNTSVFSRILRFLEWSELWLWPETSVGGGGYKDRDGERPPSFKSSQYRPLAVPGPSNTPPSEVTSQHMAKEGNLTASQNRLHLPEGRLRVEIYRRCLYCNRGEMGVHSVQQWNLSSRVPLEHNLFPDRPENFMGHTLKIVTLPYSIYVLYEKNSEDPNGPVSPRDSLDIRMIDAIAAQLNLTYEIREPLDGKWGVPLANGSWTGIVGTLHRQQADLSLDLTQTASRTEVISFTRVYAHEPMIIVSLKPGVLPRHLALLRPLTGELWVLIAASTFVFGVVLWLLQRVWSSLSGERSLGLGSTIFYSWGVLLEDPPTDPPANVSGRMLMGLWLLSSIVIGTAYRSSLIAHLAVQDKFLPINSFEDILSRDGWSWGSHRIGGTTFLYFNQSSDPVIQEIYKKVQDEHFEEQQSLCHLGSEDTGRNVLQVKFSVKIAIFP
ncbi:glutamate receptor ionotropic, kainate 4-like [Panulirus ornatus]|uniref:glutamate receptor ionotropic, kainate 4-like n=1 Tax=Panulirus ornatus TaxID=150431 RepID=UPI003A8B945D